MMDNPVSVPSFKQAIKRQQCAKIIVVLFGILCGGCAPVLSNSQEVRHLFDLASQISHGSIGLVEETTARLLARKYPPGVEVSELTGFVTDAGGTCTPVLAVSAGSVATCSISVALYRAGRPSYLVALAYNETIFEWTLEITGRDSRIEAVRIEVQGKGRRISKEEFADRRREQIRAAADQTGVERE